MSFLRGPGSINSVDSYRIGADEARFRFIKYHDSIGPRLVALKPRIVPPEVRKSGSILNSYLAVLRFLNETDRRIAYRRAIRIEREKKIEAKPLIRRHDPGQFERPPVPAA